MQATWSTAMAPITRPGPTADLSTAGTLGASGTYHAIITRSLEIISNVIYYCNSWGPAGEGDVLLV
jgi:hypothetical protein